MKKVVLFVLPVCFFANAIHAQLSKGGIPLAMQTDMGYDNIPVANFQSPSFKDIVAAREKQELESGFSKPYTVATGIPVDISFPESGSIIKVGGKSVWRTRLNVEDAKGVGLYYDKFKLPDGVSYFITNESGTQILGSYTQANNAASGLFASEPIQGTTANLELDIEAGVDINDIDFHINKAAAYFRSIEYLDKYKFTAGKPTLDYYDTSLLNQTSICMINAACPLGAGYQNEKRSALSIVVQQDENNPESIGICSATMINTADNNTTGCKDYLITASHCNTTSNNAKDHFDQMLLRFNYEQHDCNSHDLVVANTMVGAFFIARSEVDTVNYIVKGDFLLLRLKESVPLSWNVTLAGWSRDSGIVRTETAPKKFISFHHPQGDVKKVSAAQLISSGAFTPGVTGEPQWITTFDSGFVAQGSSGAGLFNGDRYVIGTLTGAPLADTIAGCNQNGNGDVMQFNPMARKAYYSKISYNWDNSAFATQKLSPWLDPLNSGVLHINGQKANCTPLDTFATTSIHSVSWSNDINVYPNPATNGNINIQFNLPDIADMDITLIDISGKVLRTYKAAKIKSGVYSINVDGFSSGMYLLRISDGDAVINKKIMLRK